jgi:hypothetical protein
MSNQKRSTKQCLKIWNGTENVVVHVSWHNKKKKALSNVSERAILKILGRVREEIFHSVAINVPNSSSML